LSEAADDEHHRGSGEEEVANDVERQSHLAVKLVVPELATAERASRGLISPAPLRESGHRLLMSALTAQGNDAEASHA
jgi:hypothetical protein